MILIFAPADADATGSRRIGASFLCDYDRLIESRFLRELPNHLAEINLSTIICSQREPASWSAMILNDEVAANAILKRATRHYTVVIKPTSAD